MSNDSQFSRDLTSGIITSFISLVYSLSFAALIFSGPLAGGLPQGISALLVGTGVTALAVALMSGFRFAVSGPDGNACAVMASMAAAVAGGLSANAAPGVAVNDVMYLLAVTTLVTGLFLTLLGTARAGRWIRFIPYPVVGGLIAAAGALTVAGALRVVTGLPPAAWLPGLAADAQLQGQVLLALAWAGALWWLMPRVQHPLALPLALLAGMLVFHLALFGSGLDPAQAREQGWLFARAPDATIWHPWSSQDLQRTDWWLLANRAGDIATLVLVTTLTVLINATGLEVETRTDTNLDRELGIQGLANVASSLAGGFLGFLSMNRSLINFRMGATTRRSGLVFAVMAVVLAWAGVGMVGWLPRPLLGGVLVYFGLLILDKWLVRTRRQLPTPDYLAMLLIVGVTVIGGFGYGLLVGIVAGCVMFAVNYSKVQLVKFSFTGSEYRSSHERSAEDKTLLAAHGGEIRIFVLQGFIFFGMADRLYRSVLELAMPDGGPAARHVVLDLRLVHGMDASAVASFKKLAHRAEASGTRIVVTGMADDLFAEWKTSGDADLLAIAHFRDLDAGMEDCEDAVIRAHRAEAPLAGEAMREWLAAEMGDGAPQLLAVLARRELGPGETLCSQDEPADAMYFIESGRVSIELRLPDGSHRRLRTMGPKTVLGEMGLYREARRSASVIVQDASIVYVLDAAAMQRLEINAPGAASRFHAMVVRTIADRLEYSNALVTALQR